MTGLFDQAAEFFKTVQGEICEGLSRADGEASFGADTWEREGGGGGVSRVLADGAVFEKAGVNWSRVEGELPEDFAGDIPGQGRSFRASGVSLVIHPRSPMVPTTHANFRYLEKGDRAWFGGGADLTPYYLFEEDAAHFHQVLAGACRNHPDVADYRRFKEWCDEYFYIAHRGEARGIGGLFFDYLEERPDETFAFAQEAARSFLPAYLPIVERRREVPYGERERTWQLQRRGRYVEFNLVYDRGTVFGLKTRGRIESILMSLPPLVRWDYDVQSRPGSAEERLLEVLRRPRNWLEEPKT